MYIKYNNNSKIIDFYSDGKWIETMSLEETALFISEVTKVLSNIKIKGEQQ